MNSSEWLQTVVKKVVEELQQGKKLQLEYDAKGRLKLLEIKTRVILKDE
jgi:hypothetical protein